MNKILLALAILGAGTAGSLTARHSTMRLQREASATRESWVVQTQVLAAAQGERARLAERIRELKQNLRQAEAAGNQKGVWSVLETNRTGDLAPDLREHLLEELGFNWNSSEAFIVVSKETLREIQMIPIRKGKLTDSAAAALALTPQERSQVEAAAQHMRADLKDWVSSHLERNEPMDDVVVHYSLPGEWAMAQSISSNFNAAVLEAVGPQRTDLIMPSANYWIGNVCGGRTDLIIKRYEVGNEQRLGIPSGGTNWTDLSSRPRFPESFLPIFPNGWADVAEREGFKLPKESQEK